MEGYGQQASLVEHLGLVECNRDGQHGRASPRYPGLEDIYM